MKKIALALTLSAFSFLLNAQTKKVLLEEFSGAHCGNCPMGSYTLDSLLGIYPDLIGVTLHSYQVPDAMFFPQIDTIGTAYAPGAPLGAIDRIYNASWGYVGEISTNWGTRIQTRLLVPPQLSVSVNSTWNSISRNISTQITTNILANMTSGDYRFNLYVVEDSVLTTGAGYDQTNLYNTIAGNPFYGMGDPIIGYVHRHVVRAILPQSWGQAGIISSTPTTGQNFTTTINYVLPAAYNENRIRLVAFVSNFSSNHQGDEVLNAIEVPLQLSSGINDETVENNISIFPNPTKGFFSIDSKFDNAEIVIYNTFGEMVLTQTLEDKKEFMDISSLASGIYFIRLSQGNKIMGTNKLLITD